VLNQQQESISNGFWSLTAEVITDVLLQSSKKQPIFVICDACYWCATYIDDTRLPADGSSTICPHCNAYSDSYDANNNRNRELSSIPIRSNESFTFNYNAKRGVELEFKPRHGGR
jgi:hypothetical protein